MNKYYTSNIPLTLAEKLKEKGMPELLERYSEIFDWLMGRGFRIMIHTKPANEPIIWFAYISTMSPDYCIVGDTRDCDTWHEAANAAIEKALTLI